MRQARYLFYLQPTLAMTKKILSPREQRIWSQDGRLEAYFRENYAAMAQAAGSQNLLISPLPLCSVQQEGESLIDSSF